MILTTITQIWSNFQCIGQNIELKRVHWKSLSLLSLRELEFYDNFHRDSISINYPYIMPCVTLKIETWYVRENSNQLFGAIWIWRSKEVALGWANFDFFLKVERIKLKESALNILCQVKNLHDPFKILNMGQNQACIINMLISMFLKTENIQKRRITKKILGSQQIYN